MLIVISSLSPFNFVNFYSVLFITYLCCFPVFVANKELNMIFYKFSMLSPSLYKV